MKSRRLVAALVLPLTIVAACWSERSLRPRPVLTLTAEEVRRAESSRQSRYELTFDLPGRVLHQDDVVIEARFVAPSGASTAVGGFASHSRFVVRFTPRETGTHYYVVNVDAGVGLRRVLRGKLVIAQRGERGFTSVDPEEPHRLVTEDGRTVFILGENRTNIYDRSWNYGNLGTHDYLRRMKSSGMTAVRVLLSSDCENELGSHQLGCLENGVGRFDEGTADALDVLFDAAEENDIDVILVAFASGYTPPPETQRSWEDNPYSSARKGPAKQPAELFEDARYHANAARRLRYIADRWASSPRLLAIDLLNEPERDGPIAERSWVPWAIEMSAAWRRVDPYHHLVTAGPVGLQSNIEGDERPWYQSKANDLVQWHAQAKEHDPHALALEMTREVQEMWSFGKPVFCGALGNGGEDESGHDQTHVSLWSLLLSGAGALAHTGPRFLDPAAMMMTPERAAHFRVLGDFLRSFDDRKAFAPAHDVTSTLDGARTFSLAARDGERAIWLLGPSASYGKTIEGGRVSFPSPPAGEWIVTWLDDTTGQTLASATVDTSGEGTMTLPVPSFRRHVAARFVRL